MFFFVSLTAAVDPSFRIATGEVTPIVPIYVSIVLSGETQPFCGGAIVSPQHVISSAHCFFSQFCSTFQSLLSVESVDAVAGMSTLTGAEKSVETIPIIAVELVNSGIAYDCSNPTSGGDIVLLTLERSFVLSWDVQTANLASARPENQTLVTVGYGVDGTTLQKISVPVTACATTGIQDGSNVAEFPVSTDQFCASEYDETGGVDACQGDGGGPLFDPSSNTVSGIVSWGFGCFGNGKYTDVSLYETLIRTKVETFEDENGGFSPSLKKKPPIPIGIPIAIVGASLACMCGIFCGCCCPDCLCPRRVPSYSTYGSTHGSGTRGRSGSRKRKRKRGRR